MVKLQQPTQKEGSQLLLVDSSVLPDVFFKVVDAKRLLAIGKVKNLSEAAKAAGISRSALYKYKDSVFIYNEALDDRVITISVNLEDRPGILSSLINHISEEEANILTVNQNIPVDGVAPVTISVRLPVGLSTDILRDNLTRLSGVVDLKILTTR